MKERPILFSAPMVRALLNDSKTQTRRIAKFEAIEPGLNMQFTGLRAERRSNGQWTLQSRDAATNLNDRTRPLYCPYGQPGDRLWVKETHYRYGKWVKAGFTASGRQRWRFKANGGSVLYPEQVHDIVLPSKRTQLGWHKRPSIFMPRWASRITLEVTGVRVERLNDISPDDAQAEGLATITKDGKLFKYGIPDRDGLPGEDNYGWPWHEWRISPVDAYQRLWTQINGLGSWFSNPWVWVVEFKQVPQ